ncbi:hypothetical protein OROGR_020366 [Orobanche gracilis]
MNNCIGSAFNSKGAMQCPNCRKIEKGQWLYANGSRPLPEFSIDDWAHDEDLYDLSYSEMSFGVQWCPFTRVPSSFDEGEFSSGAYHDLLGHHAVFSIDHDLLEHHAVFSERTPASSTSHPCPYVTYLGPIHPSSSAPSGSVSDGSTFSNHWNGPSVPGELPNAYAFPSMDINYHNWDHSSPFGTTNRVSGADQHLIPSVAQRTTRNSSNIPRGGTHPFIAGHRSTRRAPSSITSSVLPTYPGTAPRTRDISPSLQTYFQHSSNNSRVARAAPVISTGRRSSSSHRALAQVAPISTSSSDQSSGFYLFSSSDSSGRTFQEAENPHHDLFHHPWGRDQHQPSFLSGQVDHESIWGPFRSTSAGSDGGIRSVNFRQRHGSERMSSQNR